MARFILEIDDKTIEKWSDPVACASDAVDSMKDGNEKVAMMNGITNMMAFHTLQMMMSEHKGDFVLNHSRMVRDKYKLEKVNGKLVDSVFKEAVVETIGLCAMQRMSLTKGRKYVKPDIDVRDAGEI